jgi:4-amino-4-deoxy-L-arabinose transferase-like glycosyltransferase
MNIKLLTKNASLFWYFLGLLFVSFLGMHCSPLFDEDEGFFAEAARNMMQTGDYIATAVNGELRFDKPGLYFWLEALSMKLGFQNEFFARLPSFLSFLLYLFIIKVFTEKYISKKSSWKAIFIAIGMLQFQVLSKAAVTDNLLNALLAGSLLTFWDFFISGKPKKLWLFHILVALGFLCKGPIMFVLAFGIPIVFLLYKRDYKRIWTLVHPKYSFLSFSISAIWFYLAWQKSGAFLLSDFILKHNLGRFTSTMESHGGSYFYYFPVIIFAFLPFLHLFIKAVKSFVISDLNVFFGIWISLVFIFFSISKTQLPHYISYGYLPLILLMAKVDFKNYFWLKFQVIALILIFIVVPFLLGNFEFFSEDIYISNMARDIPHLFAWPFYVLMAVALLAVLFVKNKAMGFYKIVAIFCVAVSLFLNRYAELQQGFVKKIGLENEHKSETIYMTDHYNPSLSFYSQKVYPIKDSIEKGNLYFMNIKKYDANKMEIISSGSGFVLVRGK